MARIKPRTAEVTIYQGDDLAILRELQQIIQDAEKAEQVTGPPVLVGDASPLADAVAAYNAALEEATPRAVTFVFHAISRLKFKLLTAAHPPRDDDKGDEVLGLNMDTFPRALIDACWVDPTVPAEERDGEIDSLRDADFTMAWGAAYSVNRAAGVVPKALPVSGLTPKSDGM